MRNESIFGELRKYIQAGIYGISIKKYEWLAEQTIDSLLATNHAQWDLLQGDIDGETWLRRQIQVGLTALDNELRGLLLKRLAIFTSTRLGIGMLSIFPGIDLEIKNGNTHYVIVIYPTADAAGVPSAQKSFDKDTTLAISSIRHINTLQYRVDSVLGICVGQASTQYNVRGNLEIKGADFWHLISGKQNFYTEMLVPLLHQASAFEADLQSEQNEIIENLLNDFQIRFNFSSSKKYWQTLLRHTSGNYDLDNFITQPST